MKLANKKVIITGANHSIGRGIALACAQQGADVLISYRSQKEQALELVSILEETGRRAKALYAEYSTAEGVKDFFNQAIALLGGVDILVNNAAAYDTTSFLELPVETFSYMLSVNVTAPMYLINSINC